MTQTEKNLKIFIEGLDKKEKEIRAKANFCAEHKFNKECDWLRMKLAIISEIKLEAGFISDDKPIRPLFDFPD